MCQNCSYAERNLATDKEGYCLPFSSNNFHILYSENKTSVFHSDTKKDCCWRVYSESKYKGENRLISGREWKNGRYVDSNCTNINFDIRSLRRVCKNCKNE